MAMKVATTIQLSSEEDSLLTRLKDHLQFSNKKAVVLEGLRALQNVLAERERVTRLQQASKAVGKSSLLHNREWAPQASAVKVK